jgi:hypothetical protein
MATTTFVVSGTQFEELMKGVDDETRKAMEDGILLFANDADTSGTAEKYRSDKLRNVYNALVDFLVSNKLNELNPNQITFLCTGAIGDKITVQMPPNTKEIQLLPTEFFLSLLKSFSELITPCIYPIYTVTDKFVAIAKGELLPMSLGDERKAALRNSPQDQKRFREELKRKISQSKAEISSAINQIDIFFPKALNGFNENSVKNAKTTIEMLKKVSTSWGKGENATPQEKAILQAFEGKVGDAGNGMTKWLEENQGYIAKVLENSRIIAEKNTAMVKATNEILKMDKAAPVAVVGGPLFSKDAVSNIKIDVDSTNSVSVRAADAHPLKVTFSASRVMVAKQFIEGEVFKDRVCTKENVTASLEKILKIHTNLFPKDFEGKYIVPTVMIEPLRNYVDFFDDRFIMALISGDAPRRGPFMTFTPVDIQVLKLCALYLTKDNIYDYRGEVKVGTFMGDYVGKVEKNTKVKWTGADKKFSMVSTQSMEDTASREDTVGDYVDFMSAIANGTAPNPKISKRKINIMLKYIHFDQVEKNIACILKLVAQTEPGEAKDSILSFTKHNDVDAAKELIRASLKVDVQTAKMFNENPDFAITRVFGRG